MNAKIVVHIISIPTNIRKEERMGYKLKPCPFCGREAETAAAECCDFEYVDSEGKPQYMKVLFTVVCMNGACGCRIGAYEDSEMAINAWNRRE